MACAFLETDVPSLPLMQSVESGVVFHDICLLKDTDDPFLPLNSFLWHLLPQTLVIHLYRWYSVESGTIFLDICLHKEIADQFLPLIESVESGAVFHDVCLLKETDDPFLPLVFHGIFLLGHRWSILTFDTECRVVPENKWSSHSFPWHLPPRTQMIHPYFWYWL